MRHTHLGLSASSVFDDGVTANVDFTVEVLKAEHIRFGQFIQSERGRKNKQSYAL